MSKHDLIQIPLSDTAVFSICQWTHNTYKTHEVAVLAKDESTGFYEFVPLREWSGIVSKDNSFRFTDIRALGAFIAQATAWASRTVLV